MDLHKDKDARNAFLAGWRDKNRPKIRAQHKAYKLRNKERIQGHHENHPHLKRGDKLWHKYRIRWEEYEALLAKQNGLCAICQQPERVGNNRKTGIRLLSVDHNHKTGKIRGLLCAVCNLTVGNFNDSVERFYAAARYLEENR